MTLERFGIYQVAQGEWRSGPSFVKIEGNVESGEEDHGETVILATIFLDPGVRLRWTKMEAGYPRIEIQRHDPVSPSVSPANPIDAKSTQHNS